jgi:uncharacterized protein YodC (DUF2158 family)
MEEFKIGDLVVLTAGSMRMAVESVDGEQVNVVWVHEGKVGRDSFHPALLKRWEAREQGDSRPPRDGGFRRDRDEGDGQRRPGAKPPFAKPFGGPASPGPHKPRPKPTGWDGKPREKKFFRKD